MVAAQARPEAETEAGTQTETGAEMTASITFMREGQAIGELDFDTMKLTTDDAPLADTWDDLQRNGFYIYSCTRSGNTFGRQRIHTELSKATLAEAVGVIASTLNLRFEE